MEPEIVVSFVASPLRFRRSTEGWSPGRVDRDLHRSLQSNLGAARSEPRVSPPPGYEAVRFDMDDGSFALFCWDGEGAYWLGNTETPSALWRTDKYTFEEVPYPVARWAQRILLADLAEQDPWLAEHDHLAWFFLPVFFSKDGHESTRTFFAEHAAGFPDTSREASLAFYESFLRTGALDEYRYMMASKLGTSPHVDLTRMKALMGELDAAKLLVDAGYKVTPEVEVSTGHSLDFRADRSDAETVLVEVTRPVRPTHRAADSPVTAIRETAATKADGQLDRHGGGAVLFVDCSSFRDDEWAAIRAEQPAVRHRPAVVFRARPNDPRADEPGDSGHSPGYLEGYSKGSLPLDLNSAIEWVDPGGRPDGKGSENSAQKPSRD